MGFDDSYYKKIIYKKNAFDDLKMYIKLNFNNKNICFISSKSIPSEEVTKLLNALFYGSENVFHFVVRNNFSIVELDRLKTKLSTNKYDLLIAFGGGKVCDSVKYFSSVFNIPFIMCPSTASSLAYFTNYCINPYDASASEILNYPKKVFIQESVIKSASCLGNINGLSFLHSLRSIYVEGIINADEKLGYIYLGLEKLFLKLDNEQTNILLCNEDSNLVLMDLFIDFGFFLQMLGNQFYLFAAYEAYETINKNKDEYAGKDMMLIAKLQMMLIKEYLCLNSFKIIEVPNFKNVSKIIKKYSKNVKNIKNCQYFLNFMNKAYIKKLATSARDDVYQRVCVQIMKIKAFIKKVKTVYKHGIDVDADFDCVMKAISIAPYMYNCSYLVDLLAGSGVLNVFLCE